MHDPLPDPSSPTRLGAALSLGLAALVLLGLASVLRGPTLPLRRSGGSGAQVLEVAPPRPTDLAGIRLHGTAGARSVRIVASSPDGPVHEGYAGFERSARPRWIELPFEVEDVASVRVELVDSYGGPAGLDAIELVPR